jgi:preprotein translocase subunit SecD
MQKNLTAKTITIVVTLLVCIYGIIGLPKYKAELMDNLKHNIHLGLDLSGGSNLILQVQVQDALKAEADNVIEQLKGEMNKAAVDYVGIDRNDPARIEDADNIQINVKGVNAQKTTPFRGIVNERFPYWILTSVNPTDYRVNLRPTELLQVKRDTVERSPRSTIASITWESPSRSLRSMVAPMPSSKSGPAWRRRSGPGERHHRYGGCTRNL